MARLREVPIVLRHEGTFGFLKRVWREVWEDSVLDIAAAVAFYWILAVFPFLIFVLTLTPLLPGEARAAAMEQINGWVRGNLPASSADTILENVNQVFQQSQGGLQIIGLLLTLWSASAGMNATMGALDQCYDVRKRRHFLVNRGIAVLLTAFVVTMMLLVIVLVPVASLTLAFVNEQVEQLGDVGSWLAGSWQRTLLDIARYTIGILLLMLIASTVYQFGTGAKRRWTLLTPGAVVAVLFIAILGVGFRVYVEQVGNASYAKTYGTLGGLMILLLLFYFYAVIFLVGAEINSEVDRVMDEIQATEQAKQQLESGSVAPAKDPKTTADVSPEAAAAASSAATKASNQAG